MTAIFETRWIRCTIPPRRTRTGRMLQIAFSRGIRTLFWLLLAPNVVFQGSNGYGSGYEIEGGPSKVPDSSQQQFWRPSALPACSRETGFAFLRSRRFKKDPQLDKDKPSSNGFSIQSGIRNNGNYRFR